MVERNLASLPRLRVHLCEKISMFIHPCRLTWNIIMEVGKMIFLSKWVIYRFHVNLPGCMFIPQFHIGFNTILWVKILAGVFYVFLMHPPVSCSWISEQFTVCSRRRHLISQVKHCKKITYHRPQGSWEYILPDFNS